MNDTFPKLTWAPKRIKTTIVVVAEIGSPEEATVTQSYLAQHIDAFTQQGYGVTVSYEEVS